MIQHPKNVLLHIETTTHFGRDIIRGVMSFAFELGWALEFEHHSLYEASLDRLAHWSGDGIISRSGHETILNQLVKSGIPFVELVGNGKNMMPDIMADENAHAEMVFRYFFERGFRRFACFSYSDTWWTLLRKNSFITYLKSQGFSSLKVIPRQGGLS